MPFPPMATPLGALLLAIWFTIIWFAVSTTNTSDAPLVTNSDTPSGVGAISKAKVITPGTAADSLFRRSILRSEPVNAEAT